MIIAGIFSQLLISSITEIEAIYIFVIIFYVIMIITKAYQKNAGILGFFLIGVFKYYMLKRDRFEFFY